MATKRSLKKADALAIVPNREIDYLHEIKDDSFGVLLVQNTANGWWLDRGKVQRLIDAFKWSCTDEEACIHAGITIDKLKYFQELHKEFSTIKGLLKELPTLQARETVVKALKKDPAMAMKYLERKRKDEFGPNVDVTSGGEKLEGVKIAFVDFHAPQS